LPFLLLLLLPLVLLAVALLVLPVARRWCDWPSVARRYAVKRRIS
jgi:hypothetical protein